MKQSAKVKLYGNLHLVEYAGKYFYFEFTKKRKLDARSERRWEHQWSGEKFLEKTQQVSFLRNMLFMLCSVPSSYASKAWLD